MIKQKFIKTDIKYFLNKKQKFIKSDIKLFRNKKFGIWSSRGWFTTITIKVLSTFKKLKSIMFAVMETYYHGYQLPWLLHLLTSLATSTTRSWSLFSPSLSLDLSSRRFFEAESLTSGGDRLRCLYLSLSLGEAELLCKTRQNNGYHFKASCVQKSGFRYKAKRKVEVRRDELGVILMNLWVAGSNITQQEW